MEQDVTGTWLCLMEFSWRADLLPSPLLVAGCFFYFSRRYVPRNGERSAQKTSIKEGFMTFYTHGSQPFHLVLYWLISFFPLYIILSVGSTFHFPSLLSVTDDLLGTRLVKARLPLSRQCLPASPHGLLSVPLGIPPYLCRPCQGHYFIDLKKLTYSEHWKVFIVYI